MLACICLLRLMFPDIQVIPLIGINFPVSRRITIFIKYIAVYNGQNLFRTYITTQRTLAFLLVYMVYAFLEIVDSFNRFTIINHAPTGIKNQELIKHLEYL